MTADRQVDQKRTRSSLTSVANPGVRGDGGREGPHFFSFLSFPSLRPSVRTGNGVAVAGGDISRARFGPLTPPSRVALLRCRRRWWMVCCNRGIKKKESW